MEDLDTMNRRHALIAYILVACTLLLALISRAAETRNGSWSINRSDEPGKGETWAPVKGHSGYADILSGPRNGMFVNISGGKREGQSFQLERRGDQMLHIYGEGADRQVIAMPIHRAKS